MSEASEGLWIRMVLHPTQEDIDAKGGQMAHPNEPDVSPGQKQMFSSQSVSVCPPDSKSMTFILRVSALCVAPFM